MKHIDDLLYIYLISILRGIKYRIARKFMGSTVIHRSFKSDLQVLCRSLISEECMIQKEAKM